MKKVLVVCMGNICRSPTGEAILRKKAELLGKAVLIDSAGTINYHTGSPPDFRAQEAGELRGYSFKGIRSRQVTQDDFANFDLILAADKANMADLLDECPKQYRHKIALFLSFGAGEVEEVPDPYYGGQAGFEQVLDLMESAADGILARL